MSVDDLRIGHGIDVHAFSSSFDPEQPLVLAAVTLPEERSLVAHSDGDVVLHAICDALLGAVAAGDIGQHFPDNDAQYAGADSSLLLREVLDIIHERGFHLVNVDVTVIAQVPKLAPYRQLMMNKLAELLRLDAERVNLKATTTERLGYLGREEGIACHCVALLAKTA